MADESDRVAIVGGGFAGVGTARALARRLPPGWEIVVYSRENHLVFTPLLAEVIGSSINPLHCVWPVREMARGALCRTAEVTGLDLEGRQVAYRGAHGEVERESYRHLVLACGMPVRMDMVPGLAEHAWPLKTLGDALFLRNHIIGQLERAEVERDAAIKARLLSFVVIGGGFTGVEVAGAAMDLLKRSCRYYRNIERSAFRVTIVDGGKRILGPLRESLALFAQRRMRKAGIDIHGSVHAKEVTAEGIHLDDGRFIDAGTVISAVGNGVNPLIAGSGLPLDRHRVKVDPDMRVQGHENVWALGDCAAVANAYDDSISPTLAQFATRQSKQLAGNIVAAIEGRPTQPFKYHPEGVFAMIGHRNAVGQGFGIRFSGFIAWFIWHAIYLAKMPSLTRRIQIAFEWATQLILAPDIVELTTLQTSREEGTEARRHEGTK